ncbi:MAG: Hsp20/alpha crystallin family protein [Treponema sp.]|jgi:HSP20 family protein|nr:Hsp20/alpha crystallin family protein [Treponema sp.]
MNELTLFDSIFNNMLSEANPNVFYRTASVPKVDVKEDENAYTLEMELPGRSEKDVNIELEHGNLTISSKIEEVEDKEEKKHKAKWILKERRTSSFTRRFTLPSDVDGENITANFKNGILTVMMQKKAIPAPKKISIEAQ